MKKRRSPAPAPVYPFLDKSESALSADERLAMELAVAQGMPLTCADGYVRLATAGRPYTDELWCFVDIETTASKPQNSYIIEIGALKVRHGEIIDSFESFGWAPEVPNYITDVTGITTTMIADAPRQFQLLREFRAFLGDAVFVAHNIGFDYDYLSAALNQTNLGKLANRKLCTIDLAKRTIEAEKYGLAHLSEELSLDNDQHHRAYNDALMSMKIFEKALEAIPPSVVTTEDLIRFSTQAPVLVQTPSKARGSQESQDPAKANADGTPVQPRP